MKKSRLSLYFATKVGNSDKILDLVHSLVYIINVEVNVDVSKD
jgi:hypothetical protein